MKKITQLQQESFIREKLSNNKQWVVKGLLRIFEYQTLDEQKNDDVKCHNNVGFTVADARILSSFVRHWKRKGWFSNKQYQVLFIRMPKYAGQLRRISDLTVLNNKINQSQLSIGI